VHPFIRIALRYVRLILAAVVVLYVAEDVFLRFRLHEKQSDAVFSQVPVYDVGEVKGGRVEYYFDQGQTQTCVHAVFPHFGAVPCWYVVRHTAQQVRLAPAPRSYSGLSVKLESIVTAGRRVRYTGHFPANTPWTRSIVSRLSSGATIVNAM